MAYSGAPSIFGSTPNSNTGPVERGVGVPAWMWYHNQLGSRCKTIWRQCVARFRLSYLRIRARVFNATEGSTVAVFGCGCVGLSCINAAKLVEASRVIAIDVNPAKEEWARKFGATEFINPRKFRANVFRTTSLSSKMADSTLRLTRRPGVSCAHHQALSPFNLTIQVDVMRSALEACHKGWGVSTVIGVAAAGKEISTRP